MKKILIPLVLLLLTSVDAYACSRCGLFGNRCRYYKAPVYYAPAAVVKQADVFVVQNNYPQPISATYAQQGNTVYGVQAASLAYFANPQETLRQSAEMVRAASATFSLGINGYNQLAGTTLAYQAAVSEPLARGAAASQVLQAAGFTAGTTQSQTLALKITQGANGQWQIQSADPGQVQAQMQAAIGDHPPVPAPTSKSILSAKCSRCHGLALREPKKGIFLDAGHKLDCVTAWNVIRQVDANKMPPEGDKLTQEEKGLLLRELDSLVQLPTTNDNVPPPPPENPQ